MTSVSMAEHGPAYLNAMIGCCTREIVGWSLEFRCSTEEAITVVNDAVTARGVPAGSLTLGTDNGSAFTSRRVKAALVELGITHRRGGYRDPASQAFIESWFGGQRLHKQRPKVSTATGPGHRGILRRCAR